VVQFNDWCTTVDSAIGNYGLRVLTGNPADSPTGIQSTAAIVPIHYAAEEQVSRALARLGKPAAAALIQGKLPTTKAIRSGDLGEIFATEWIEEQSGGYRAPIKRLRWKDHRNMAMRGEDVIGLLQDPQSQRLRFLKTEAKSRAALTAQVLTEARAGLDKNGGLPSAHALSFISARLLELGDIHLADAIDDALLKHGLTERYDFRPPPRRQEVRLFPPNPATDVADGFLDESICDEGADILRGVLSGDSDSRGDPALRYFLRDIRLGRKSDEVEEVEEDSLLDRETDNGDPHRNPVVKEFGRT